MAPGDARLIGAVRLSLGSAWLFLIAAEAIAATEGLGYRIFLVRRYLAMDVILPYVAWITFLAFAIDFALARYSRWRYPGSTRPDKGGTMATIELKNLWKEYGDQVVLERLNAEVEEGEFVTVVGASGCGKTTFLKLLLGTESPTRGQLLLDGKPIPDEPDESRGIVFQRYSVLPHLNALANVMLCGELETSRWLGRAFGETRKRLREQAVAMLESVGLGGALDKYPMSCPAACSSAWPWPRR